MATVSIAPFAVPQFFSNTGEALSGGTVETYLAGTSTPEATYSDNGSTTNATTITLNSAGRPHSGGTLVDIRLDITKSYKFILKDTDGNTIRTVDNILGGLPAASVGASQIADGSITAAKLSDTQSALEAITSKLEFLQTGTGAEYRNLDAKVGEFVSILDFIPESKHAGILAGSNTDDLSSYYTAALDAHDNIWFPKGTYHGHLDMSARRGKTIRGAGRDVTVLKNYGATNVITLDNTSSDCKMNHFSDFRIINRDEATYTSADGVYCTGNGTNENDFHIFARIEIVNMRYGFHYDKRAVWHSFEDVHVYSCVDGFHVDTDDNISAFGFRQVRFGQNTGYGMYIEKAAGDLLSSWTFDDVTLEKNGLNGLRVSGAASGIGGWVINGLYCEENTTSIAASGTSPRKANVYIDAAYCVGITMNSPQLFGTPSGDQVDWHIYMDSTCTNASGVILAARWGVTAAVGAYTLTQFMTVIGDFGTVGSSVAPRGSQNFIMSDITGSSTSWTPALSFGGGSTGLTYGTQEGRYVRHGNILFFWFYIALSAKGSSTGAATITGLPVASLNVTNLFQPITVTGDQFAATVDGFTARVAANSQTITLLRFFDGVHTALADTDFGNSTAIAGHGTIVLL